MMNDKAEKALTVLVALPPLFVAGTALWMFGWSAAVPMAWFVAVMFCISRLDDMD